jgi:hypothetical protein
VERAVGGVNDDLDRTYGAVGEQRLDGVPQHGEGAERLVLLGNRPAEAMAASGRNDQSRRQHPPFPLLAPPAYMAERVAATMP